MIHSTQKGKFITIEGIEGVGKSSNVNFIANLIQNAGNEVIVTREPGGTPIAEAIRGILLSEFEETTLAETELLLLYAGRLQHVEHVIKPALNQGKWVVCDRFTDATYAYQGAGRGIAIEKIDEINRWAMGNFHPDLTIILDAPVEAAFERIQKNRNLDRIEKEKMSFFEKIRQQYLQMAKQSERYYVVDASNPLAAVQSTIQNILKDKL
ncbi:MAG: dTMP kinase [Gammaproteobacteria bacterium]|jgi:dTMP kinase|nr:dTMP kinase [Gammaproteobacteria bacterium]